MVQAVTLPILQAGGFSASVEAFAWEPDPNPATSCMRLWFLSLLGSQEAVKALWARLVKGELATLSMENLGRSGFYALAPEGPRGWRFFSASLRAAGCYHGVLVPSAAFFTTERPDFLLLVRQTEEVASLHYRFLNRRLALPLHSDWAGWLWQRALRTGEAVPLESRGLDAYRCHPNHEALAADLGAGVRKGELGLDKKKGEPFAVEKLSS